MISEKKIHLIEKILQYKFKNTKNLINSLIHPSVYKHKKKSKKNDIYEFERLEFLGDRVLGLVVSSLIFKKFTDYNEGNLSKKLSFLVQRDFLFKISQDINLVDFLEFNKQKKQNLIMNKSIIADSFESLIGAIFVDGGYHKSYNFIKRLWSPHLKKLIEDEIDPKTKLQEITQKKYKKLPNYRLIKKEGPPHSPKFTIQLSILNIDKIKAVGTSIRDAEKKAAKKVLKLLNEN